MKLTREQRFLLTHGGQPRLTFPGGEECPVEIGYVHRVTPKFEIVVLEIRRSRKGEWVLTYLIRDDRPNFLRSVPPVHRHKSDEYGEVLPPEPGDIEAARLEGSYTHSPHGRVPSAGEAVVEADQTLLAMRARAKWAQREDVDEAQRRKQERALRERLRETLSGLTPVAQQALLVRIEREIEAAQEELAA